MSREGEGPGRRRGLLQRWDCPLIPSPHSFSGDLEPQGCCKDLHTHTPAPAPVTDPVPCSGQASQSDICTTRSHKSSEWRRKGLRSLGLCLCAGGTLILPRPAPMQSHKRDARVPWTLLTLQSVYLLADASLGMPASTEVNAGGFNGVCTQKSGTRGWGSRSGELSRWENEGTCPVGRSGGRSRLKKKSFQLSINTGT